MEPSVYSTRTDAAQVGLAERIRKTSPELRTVGVARRAERKHGVGAGEAAGGGR